MFETVTKNGRVLVLIPADRMILDGDAALELAVSARYETGGSRLIIPKECFPPEFFWLSTGLAGEILQKWINYQFQVAIYGDFTRETAASKPLRDFLAESNRGTGILFPDTRQEAVDRLSQL